MRLQKRFYLVVYLLSSLPHSKWSVCSFFGDLHGRLDLELEPKLFYCSTVWRVFVFLVLLPPSTADVACPRFVHTDESWRSRAMLGYSIFSFLPRPMRLVTSYMLPTLFLFVFARHGLHSRFVVGLSLLLGVLIFPRMSSLHVIPSHLVLRHFSYCYRVRAHVVDHWLHVERPP